MPATVHAYLDAAVLVSLHIPDTFHARATGFLEAARTTVVISDFAATEFAAVMSRLTRTGALTASAAKACFENFDVWTERAAHRVVMESADLRAASGYIRRLDTPLRAPDAIHVAIARRLGASLATFDRQLAAAAAAFGVAVADI